MKPFPYERIFRLQDTHWRDQARRKPLDLLLKNHPRHGKVPDVCGPGSMLLFLENYGDVTGIDSFAIALKMARKTFQGHLIRGSVAKLPFLDNHFCLITACVALYHREVNDVGQAVRKMVRVLAPEGYLIVVDPAYPFLSSSHGQTAHAARRFTRSQMHLFFQHAEIKVVHATYAYAALFPLVWIVRKIKKLKMITQHGNLR